MRIGGFALLCVIVASLLIFVLPGTAQEQMQVTYMGSRLRLRDAPTTNSNTLQFLNPGDALNFIQMSNDGLWTEVTLVSTGLQGWVASEFIEPIRVTAPDSEFEFTDVVYNGVTIVSGINQNAIDIFNKGQAMGNRANVFTKVGDSITFTPWFLDNIGDGRYTLAEHGYLQGAINHFNSELARDENSFKHNSVAMASGWNAGLMQDPDYADPFLCQAGETPLECEYRITKPAIALIMFGTNDVGFMDGFAFRVNMEWVVQTSIDNGVIPVISTIPNRLDKQAEVPGFNAIVRDIARKYNIPLWDYKAILDTLPNGGLSEDGVHPNSSPLGGIGQSDFTEANLQYGFPLRNFTAVEVLNALLNQVILRA